MNKIAIATLAFAGGTAFGFVMGKFVVVDKEEPVKVNIDDIRKEEPKQPAEKIEKVDPAELESPRDDDPSSLLSAGPAHVAMTTQKSVDYSNVQKIVKDNSYMTQEEIEQVMNEDEPEDESEDEEDYEETGDSEEEERSEAMAEYRKKNKDQIVPITRDEWESEFPEVDYEKADLYYFQGDGVLTDDEGRPLDIEEYMGIRPGQFGWYDNADERIYIRNNPKETDYQVWKQHCASEEWW